MFQVRIVAGQIGRVGDDRVEDLVAQGSKPVTTAQFHVAKAQQHAVALGHRDGCATAIDADNTPAPALTGQRQSDRARSRTQIRHASPRLGRARGERPFDQQFGFGTRDQRGLADPQRQRPEFPPA